MDISQSSSTKVIIIEDEINTREFIVSLLGDSFPEFHIVGESGSVQQGISLIEKHKPDLVLMDIHIHNGTGFDILHATSSIDYSVIFITSYLEYSIEAIRVSALDYVLKPLIVEDFINGINRFKKKSRQLDTPKILIEGAHRQLIIPLDEIIYVEVKKGFCIFKLDNDKTMYSREGITNYGQDLTDPIYKIHRNYYVNLKFIESIDRGRGGFTKMRSGDIIPIAYRRKKEIHGKWLSLLNENK
jgi:two-component system LytT family response regulator